MTPRARGRPSTSSSASESSARVDVLEQENADLKTRLSNLEADFRAERQSRLDLEKIGRDMNIDIYMTPSSYIQTSTQWAVPRISVQHAPAPVPAKANMRKEMEEDNWEALVAPLHPVLRDEIVRYGELVAACYKAFDLDPSSDRYLNCKYGKKNMLRGVGMQDAGYEVTKYVYATPDISLPIPTQNGSTCCSRWIGYVAVSSSDVGRRDIVVSFRGTVTSTEWIANLMSSLEAARFDPHDPRPDVKVASGFLNLYTSGDSSTKFGSGSCREQLLAEVSRLLHKYKGEEVSITLAGHSMGSALALLLGYDIAELGLNRGAPVMVYSYGGPRVGNAGFKQRCEELGVKVLRVANVNDPVTKLPGVIFNENFRNPMGGSLSSYAHVGVELALDFFKVQDPVCVHDLDAYIRLLKCHPKNGAAVQAKRNRDAAGDIARKARELLSSVQVAEAWTWQDAAMQLGNWMQLINI
ncbi:phospholipase A1 EG1, chloroplastic/mitochondrial-like [Zingiber officinale]|uniref:phospholipase A1 EG1, chloroplastic/mitochondrial-like n=1 Tax=Zingiber officinale TaxID=94328 RepID=UPI001C4D9DB6|nr:phospholipase A1 EG1, chloroplastic/mitochondrial-like [Zingiber officinale]